MIRRIHNAIYELRSLTYESFVPAYELSLVSLQKFNQIYTLLRKYTREQALRNHKMCLKN